MDIALQHLNDLLMQWHQSLLIPFTEYAHNTTIEVQVPQAHFDLGVDIAPRLTITRVEEPPAREAGIKVSDVAELVDKLKNEAKVI